MVDSCEVFELSITCLVHALVNPERLALCYPSTVSRLQGNGNFRSFVIQNMVRDALFVVFMYLCIYDIGCLFHCLIVSLFVQTFIENPWNRSRSFKSANSFPVEKMDLELLTSVVNKVSLSLSILTLSFYCPLSYKIMYFVLI